MVDAQGLAEGYGQLYSLSARMLWAQGVPTWRGSGWPAERARYWRQLEALLLDDLGAEYARGEVVPDPARHLLSRWAAGTEALPVSFGVAVGEWEARLDGDPGPLVLRSTPASSTAIAPDRAVIVSELWYLTMSDLLDELVYRLGPGRPVNGLSSDAAELSAKLHELADALRRPITGAATQHPVEAMPPAIASRPISGRPGLAGAYDRLRRAARRAAEAVPSGMDLSVAPEVSAAASDVLRAVAGEPVPEWRERHEGIDAARHLAYGYRWEGVEGRPLPFGERAREISSSLADVPGPRVSDDYQPPPEEAPERDWVVFSRAAALVRAELLDELAARLHPGTVAPYRLHATASSVCEFLRGRLKGVPGGR